MNQSEIAARISGKDILCFSLKYDKMPSNPLKGEVFSVNAAEYQFRTAAFGGFQKQDVVAYLEASSKEHAEKVQALEQELSQLRQGREELEKRCGEGEDKLTLLTADKTRLEGDLAEKTQALETAQTQLEEKSAALAAAQAELTQLRARVRELEPSAEAYESLKDRTAGVELEAHHRAQMIEDEACEKAKESAQEVERWLGKVRAGYDRLRTDLDATLAHASGELERVSKSLGGLTAEFDEHGAALERIGEAFRSASGPQPPKPLDLDGE